MPTRHCTPLESRRLFATDVGGGLVTAFGNGGTVADGSVITAPLTLALTPAATLVGATADGGVVVRDGQQLERLLPSGKPDRAYGTAGVASPLAGITGYGGYAIRSAQLLANGSALIFATDGLAAGVVVRLNPAGDGVATYGTAGKLYVASGYSVSRLEQFFGNSSTVNTVLARPDGKLLDVYNASLTTNGGLTFTAVNDLNLYDAEGGNKTTLAGTDATTPLPAGALRLVAVDPAGAIYLTSTTSGVASLVRLLPTGAPDLSFGTAGVVAPADGQTLDPIAVEPDGSLLVATRSATSTDPTADVRLERLTHAGTVDPAFGTAGAVAVALTSAAAASVAALPDGGFIVVGARTPEDADQLPTYTATRYAADGTVDAAFGTDGSATGSVTGSIDATGLPDPTVAVTGVTVVGSGDVYVLATLTADNGAAAAANTADVVFEIDAGPVVGSTTPTPSPTATPTPTSTLTGVQLVAAARHAPTSAVARQRTPEVLGLTLTNDGVAAFTGRVAFTLRYADASSDAPSIDGGTIVRAVHLRTGRSTTVRLPVRSLPAGLDGSYVVTASAALSGDTTGASATAYVGTVDVAAPVTALSVAPVPPTGHVNTGQTYPVTVTLTNAGNVPAVGRATLMPGLSIDGATLDVTGSRSTVRHINLKPGRSVRLRVRLAVPTDATLGNRYVGVNVAFDDTVTTAVSHGVVDVH